MDEDKLEELLRQYVPSAEKKQLNAYPKDEDIDRTYSKQFEEKMDKLIKRAKLKESYKIPVRTGQRVAVLILVIVLGMLTVSMSVRAVREKIFEIFKTVSGTEDRMEYKVEKGEEPGEFVPKYPEYIPDGFEKELDEADEFDMTQRYVNGDKEILLSEIPIRDGTMIAEDNEYQRLDREKVRGESAEIGYKNGGIIDIKWHEDNCRFIVSGIGLSKAELLEICNSLK